MPIKRQRIVLTFNTASWDHENYRLTENGERSYLWEGKQIPLASNIDTKFAPPLRNNKSFQNLRVHAYCEYVAGTGGRGQTEYIAVLFIAPSCE